MQYEWNGIEQNRMDFRIHMIRWWFSLIDFPGKGQCNTFQFHFHKVNASFGGGIRMEDIFTVISPFEILMKDRIDVTLDQF